MKYKIWKIIKIYKKNIYIILGNEKKYKFLYWWQKIKLRQLIWLKEQSTSTDVFGTNLIFAMSEAVSSVFIL